MTYTIHTIHYNMIFYVFKYFIIIVYTRTLVIPKTASMGPAPWQIAGEHVQYIGGRRLLVRGRLPPHTTTSSSHCVGVCGSMCQITRLMTIIGTIFSHLVNNNIIIIFNTVVIVITIYDYHSILPLIYLLLLSLHACHVCCTNWRDN